MLRMSFSCERCPALYFMSKREMPSAVAVAAIFRATVSGKDGVRPVVEIVGALDAHPPDRARRPREQERSANE